MKVFISWSGDKSRAVATALNEWLPTVLQSIEPWFSPDNIAKGAAWFSKIQEGLTNCKAGVICLTAENKDSPWILFESGAIARGVGSGSVATLLIDLAVQDVVGPLAQFNHTAPDRTGISKLVSDLNDLSSQPLTGQRLAAALEGMWPSFEKKLKEAQKISASVVAPRRETADMITELLELARQQTSQLSELKQGIQFRRLNAIPRSAGMMSSTGQSLSGLGPFADQDLLDALRKASGPAMGYVEPNPRIGEAIRKILSDSGTIPP